MLLVGGKVRRTCQTQFQNNLRSGSPNTGVMGLSCEKALRLVGSGLGIGSCVSAVCTVCVCGCCGCCRRSRSDTHVHTQVVDLSQTSCHGKSYADGASNVPTCHLRQAAKSGEAVAPGTRGLVLFLADKMREPSSPKDGRWMSVDEYLVAYYPCLLYTSPSPRDYAASRMPSSA